MKITAAAFSNLAPFNLLILIIISGSAGSIASDDYRDRDLGEKTKIKATAKHPLFELPDMLTTNNELNDLGIDNQYFANVMTRVQKVWYPPKDCMYPTVVGFSISKKGTITGLHIEKSSGMTLCDKAALMAIENAAPFDPLPIKKIGIIDIRFVFTSKILNGPGKGTFRHF